MGVDSRGINRGECSHPRCPCMDFQRSYGTGKCYVCGHPAASHKPSPQALGAGNDKRTSPTPAAHHSTDRGAVSHATALSGWHSSRDSHDSQPHQHYHMPWGAVGGLGGMKACYSCETVNPGRDSSQTPAKESAVNHGAIQPPTRSWPQSDDVPTTLGITPGAPPTQQPNCKLSKDVACAMSLYDKGKLQTVKGTKGKMAGHKLPPKPTGLVIGKERARGSYGTVHSGELDGSPVVVKKLHHALLQAPNNDKLMTDFYRECRILSTIRHANVVRFIGAYLDQEVKEPLLVMEAAKENLREFLERNKAHLGVEKQLAICSNMAEGLQFLHERAEPIIHRDLKPQNVLVWEDGTVKIGDFGQSKLLDQPQSYMKTTQPGTVIYMPPEALKKNSEYTSKVDVFSLGAVMLEVCTQSPPSLSLVGIGTVPEVERREDDLTLLEDTHPLKPLIIWCLQDSHESRPNVKSTHAQVKLLEGGVKEADYQQRIRQLEVALRESRERETGLQTRLEEAVSELECTKAQVADLRIVVEKGHQEARETKLQYETELTHLRQTLDAWKATVERRDKECLSKVKELESLLGTRRCSATMQSAGELVSSMLPSPLMTSTTAPSQCGVICSEKEAVGGEVGEKRVSGNSKTPAKKSSVNHGAMSQPPTKYQSNDTPTAAVVTSGAPPIKQPPPPQSQARMKYRNCKLTYDVVRAVSLYNGGMIQTVNSTKGMLVTSIELNKDTLACGVQPLDLITQLDGKRAESLGDPSGQCNLRSKILMTNGVADAWIARMSQIPSMSDLQGLVESHQSSRMCRIVGFLVTQKDLMDPASFLGVHMDRHSNGRKVDRVEVLKEADKAGLRENDIIESVTLVTTDGEVHGLEAEWSFDSISRTAKKSPSVFTLLMTVLNY